MSVGASATEQGIAIYLESVSDPPDTNDPESVNSLNGQQAQVRLLITSTLIPDIVTDVGSQILDSDIPPRYLLDYAFTSLLLSQKQDLLSYVDY